MYKFISTLIYEYTNMYIRTYLNIWVSYATIYDRNANRSSSRSRSSAYNKEKEEKKKRKSDHKEKKEKKVYNYLSPSVYI
jgi:hypothetical protein